MPGMDGTGPFGTGRVGGRRGRCSPVVSDALVGVDSLRILNHEQAGETLSRMDRGVFPSSGRRMRDRIGQKFRGGE